MVNNSDPRPPAVFPLQPPLAKLPFVNPDGMLTVPALNFLYLLWAGIQGRNGILDLLNFLKQFNIVPGFDGQDGQPGFPGMPGLDGLPGKDALPIPGHDAEDGFPGAPGLDGRNGLSGQDAPPGMDGEDGEMLVINPPPASPPTFGISLDAAFSKTNNNTLANVTGTNRNLSLNLVANHTYSFQGVMFVTSGASHGGVRAAVGGTVTASAIVYDGFDMDTGGTPVHGYTQAAALATMVADATTLSDTTTIYIHGVITVSASGTLTLQFAQSTTNATASVVGVGSYLVAEDIT